MRTPRSKTFVATAATTNASTMSTSVTAPSLFLSAPLMPSIRLLELEHDRVRVECKPDQQREINEVAQIDDALADVIEVRLRAEARETVDEPLRRNPSR